jgi:hypothetical protein
MALAVTITSVEASGNCIRIGFRVVPSGVYTTAIGGDPLNLATATQGIGFEGPAAAIPSSLPPIDLKISNVSGLLGYRCLPVIGATQATCALTWESIATLGTELGTGAYPAAIIAATWVGTALFKKGL